MSVTAEDFSVVKQTNWHTILNVPVSTATTKGIEGKQNR